MLATLIAVITLSLLPTLLFLGLCRLLKHGQSQAIVQNSAKRTNEEVSVLSLKEVTTNAIHSRSLIPDTPPTQTTNANTQTHNNRCSICNAKNNSIAVYCKNCNNKI